jgi:hypothetical protein
LRNPASYYIDVGASDLIVDGSIKLRSSVRVDALGEHTVLLSDGSELPADVLVYATGYDRGLVSKVLPGEIAQKVDRRWGLGSGIRNDPGRWEGELRNIWKPTQQTGLWFHSHGIGGGQIYSKALALQIKAREVAIPTPVYKLAEVYHKAPAMPPHQSRKDANGPLSWQFVLGWLSQQLLLDPPADSCIRWAAGGRFRDLRCQMSGSATRGLLSGVAHSPRDPRSSTHDGTGHPSAQEMGMRSCWRASGRPVGASWSRG